MTLRHIDFKTIMEEENKINIEELIDKKRDEVIAKVSADAKGLEQRILSNAINHFAILGEELKQAYSAQVVGPEDLLRAIEKGGLVHREIVDIREQFNGRVNVDVRDFSEKFIRKRFWGNYKQLSGKQRVTIIIEPLEE